MLHRLEQSVNYTPSPALYIAGTGHFVIFGSSYPLCRVATALYGQSNVVTWSGKDVMERDLFHSRFTKMLQFRHKAVILYTQGKASQQHLYDTPCELNKEGEQFVVNWAEFLSAVWEACPYLLFLVLGFLGAFLMFKASIKEIRENADRAIEQIRLAYGDACQIVTRAK